MLVVLLLGVPLAGGCGALSSSNDSGSGGPWDAQSPDGGHTGLPGDANACTPGNVQTFVPNGYRSANPVSGACTLDQITQYYDNCFGIASSPAACAAFTRASINTTCSGCVLTSTTATAYGPLLGTGALVQTNVAGCIELTEPSLVSCARSVQARSACEAAACSANCPVSASDPSTLAAYDACTVAAGQDGCSTVAYPVPCLGVMDAEAGPYVGCLAGSFADYYEYAVPLFCGPNALPPPPEEDGGPADAATSDDAESSPSDAVALDASAADAARDGSPNDGAPSDAERGDAARDAGSALNDAGHPRDAGADATLAPEGGGDADAYSAVSAEAAPDGAESDY